MVEMREKTGVMRTEVPEWVATSVKKDVRVLVYLYQSEVILEDGTVIMIKGTSDFAQAVTKLKPPRVKVTVEVTTCG